MTDTSQVHLSIQAVDTLMFRDGRPFNQGDPGASEAVSVFPPPPPTVAGLVRAALAADLGWNVGGSWPSGALGNGVNWQRKKDQLAPLSFSSTTVVAGNKAWYPAPRNLLASKSGDRTRSDQMALLQPGLEIQTDLGVVRLPAPDRALEGLDGFEGWWISATGLGAVLTGLLPAATDLSPPGAFWQSERRVGIGINGVGVDDKEQPITNLKSRRPIDGALFMPTHTRTKHDVALHVTVTTTEPSGLALIDGRCLTAAGGEGRMVDLVAVLSAPERPGAPASLPVEGGRLRYCVYHAGPCHPGAWPRPGEPLAGLPGVVVSACLGRAQMIGGWNTQARGPIAMTVCIPAGSVWFIEANDDTDHSGILARHGTHIGRSTAWGFGQIFIGTW